MEDILSVSQWALIIGALIPILVGAITKATASPALKAVMLLTLELVNGVLVDWFATPNGFDVRGALVTAFVAWVTGVATYYGFLRHTVAPVVIDATARFGVGGSREVVPEPWQRKAG